MFLVFARALDDRLASLAKAIETNVAENKGDKRSAFFVLLTDNNAENQKQVAAFAEKRGATLPMTIALDGSKGPGAYKLNPDVPLTVLLYKGKKVKANFALPAASDDEAQAKEAAAIVAAAGEAFQ